MDRLRRALPLDSGRPGDRGGAGPQPGRMSLALPRRVSALQAGTSRRGWREGVVPGDVLLTVLALAVSSLPLVHDAVGPGWRWALTLGLVLPLLVRRTAPVLAL